MAIWVAYALLTLAIATIVFSQHLARKHRDKWFHDQVILDISAKGIDIEAQRCYDWEEAVVSRRFTQLGMDGLMNETEAQVFADKLSKAFGFDTPRVTISDFNGQPITGVSVDGHRIIVRKQTDLLVMTHELTHCFLYQDGHRAEAHSRNFIHCYIDLLEYIGVTDIRHTVHAWAVDTTPNEPSLGFVPK